MLSPFTLRQSSEGNGVETDHYGTPNLKKLFFFLLKKIIDNWNLIDFRRGDAAIMAHIWENNIMEEAAVNG